MLVTIFTNRLTEQRTSPPHARLSSTLAALGPKSLNGSFRTVAGLRQPGNSPPFPCSNISFLSSSLLTGRNPRLATPSKACTPWRSMRDIGFNPIPRIDSFWILEAPPPSPGGEPSRISSPYMGIHTPDVNEP